MNRNLIYQNLPVRLITDENEQIWFAGIDICEILEYANPTVAIKKLDEDERKLASLKVSSDQKRKTWMINESGLFSLILTSSKPEAKAFKRWVTHEVLPQIRKAGKFTIPEIAEREQSQQRIAAEINQLQEERLQLIKRANDLRHTINVKSNMLLGSILNPHYQLALNF